MSGTLKLKDLRTPYVKPYCNECNRAGQYLVENLISQYGPNFTVPDFAASLEKDCPRAGHNKPCRVRFLNIKT